MQRLRSPWRYHRVLHTMIHTRQALMGWVQKVARNALSAAMNVLSCTSNSALFSRSWSTAVSVMGDVLTMVQVLSQCEDQIWQALKG